MNEPADRGPSLERGVDATPAALQPIPVRRHGDRGPSVVVLHGGPGAPGSAWDLARALGADHRVLEPLQRRAGAVPLTVAQHVADLAAVSPPTTRLVGCSWGAMLGLSFAATHPERVSHLVLVGCGTYDEDARAALRAARARCLGPAGERRAAELEAALEGTTDPDNRDGLLAALGELHARAASYDRLEGTPAPPEDLPPDATGHEQTWADVLRLQRGGIEPERFAAIRARVLMVHGDVDPHPGPATRDRLRRFVPQLEYVPLPRCGHEPWRERHARNPLLSVLREFLARD